MNNKITHLAYVINYFLYTRAVSDLKSCEAKYGSECSNYIYVLIYPEELANYVNKQAQNCPA